MTGSSSSINIAPSLNSVPSSIFLPSSSLTTHLTTSLAFEPPISIDPALLLNKAPSGKLLVDVEDCVASDSEDESNMVVHNVPERHQNSDLQYSEDEVDPELGKEHVHPNGEKDIPTKRKTRSAASSLTPERSEKKPARAPTSYVAKLEAEAFKESICDRVKRGRRSRPRRDCSEETYCPSEQEAQIRHPRGATWIRKRGKSSAYLGDDKGTRRSAQNKVAQKRYRDKRRSLAQYNLEAIVRIRTCVSQDFPHRTKPQIMEILREEIRQWFEGVRDLDPRVAESLDMEM
ncbi:hypothetical protein BD324DRAFT_94225 [Kockovaella imperatae]|uniref:BZIP domain-containing protein n=1 Tax=Kockovaella imperatae TaxID=4999 RepID=A0A1Y1UE78_9TREE|nr:hypothetical protein BD324DRAFT_94225 [Kockovaella imperatae]ORX35385.1 hypothetical protein BD324DRAFT_94225 [Kockovaella imperatae]